MALRLRLSDQCRLGRNRSMVVGRTAIKQIKKSGPKLDDKAAQKGTSNSAQGAGKTDDRL